MNENYCELQFDSQTTKVRQIVNRLLEFIDSHAPATSARDDLRLVFSELLYNAVIHGNKGDRSKHVQVQLKAESDRIYVCVRDEGCGFDHEEATSQAVSEKSLLEENGRGMILVRALTENLCFNKSGNQISFEKGL